MGCQGRVKSSKTRRGLSASRPVPNVLPATRYTRALVGRGEIKSSTAALVPMTPLGSTGFEPDVKMTYAQCSGCRRRSGRCREIAKNTLDQSGIAEVSESEFPASTSAR